MEGHSVGESGPGRPSAQQIEVNRIVVGTNLDQRTGRFLFQKGIERNRRFRFSAGFRREPKRNQDEDQEYDRDFFTHTCVEVHSYGIIFQHHRCVNKAMSSDIEKAQSFVSRLLQNPALRDFTPLQREEQLIQFLHVNSAQLAPTLSSQQFFPGKNWNQIFTILLETLYGLVNEALLPEIEQSVAGINYTFLQFLRQQQADDTLVKGQISKLVTGLMQKPDARRGFTGAFSALRFHSVDRYLDEAFARKTYIHFELTKVQRLRMGRDEIKSFVELTLLLKPVINLISSSAPTQQERRSPISRLISRDCS